MVHPFLAQRSGARDSVRGAARAERARPIHPTALVAQRTFTASTAASGALAQRYHFFVSHMQAEASGDVGTLFFLFEQMGVHGWRDMNQDDLTEAGMRQGVRSSDIFILFLTNAVLSRPFCLKEIAWALEFEKPILVVIETAARFWPFDVARWRRDELRLDAERNWAVDPRLKSTYAQCPGAIKVFVESCVAGGRAMPFRRRHFEVDALAREILRRAHQARRAPGQDRVLWGGILPPTSAMRDCDARAPRRVVVVCTASPRARAVQRELAASLSAVAPNLEWCVDGRGATHAIVLLSNGLLDESCACAALLNDVVAATCRSVFLYLDPDAEGEEEGWDFSATLPESDASAAIARHEALRWRGAMPELMRYEHDALVLELLKRMKRSSASE